MLHIELGSATEEERGGKGEMEVMITLGSAREEEEEERRWKRRR